MKKPNTKNQAIRRSWAYRNRNINPMTKNAEWNKLPNGVVTAVAGNANTLDRIDVIYFGDGSFLRVHYGEENWKRVVGAEFEGERVTQDLCHNNLGLETKWSIPALEVKSPSAPWTLKINGGKITGMNYQEAFEQQSERHLEQVREFQRTIAKLENVLRQQKAITKACEKIANDRGNVIKQLTRAVIEQTDSSIKLKAALHSITAEANLMGLLSCLRPPNSTVTTGEAVKRLIAEGDTHHGRAKALFEAAKGDSEKNGCEAIKAAQQEVRSERVAVTAVRARAPWDH